MAQGDDRLVFIASGRKADVAAYFHTGGTTGVPGPVTHIHRSQLTAVGLGRAEALGRFRPTASSPRKP